MGVCEHFTVEIFPSEEHRLTAEILHPRSGSCASSVVGLLIPLPYPNIILEQDDRSGVQLVPPRLASENQFRINPERFQL